MAAAAITPTLVQKTYKPAINSYGAVAGLRNVEYLVKLTKATAADWIVAATYTPGTVIGFNAVTIDSSGNGAQDGMTYLATGTKLLLSGASVGTTYMKVLCQEA
jgi:hypothetical protein